MQLLVTTILTVSLLFQCVVSGSHVLGDVVVRAAIKAHGFSGIDGKPAGIYIKVAGRDDTTMGLKDPTFIEEIFQSGANRYRCETRYHELDAKRVLIVNGGKVWHPGEDELDDNEDIRQMNIHGGYTPYLDQLAFLRNPEIRVFLVPGARVRGKPAQAVLVKGHRRQDVTLYFDKETHLLVKRKQTVFSLMDGKFGPEEVFFHYPGQGRPVNYSHLVIMQNGKKVWEASVVERKEFEKLDPRLFARPAAVKK